MMSNAKKMVVIPEQTYLELKKKQSSMYTPRQDEIFNLEKEMDNIAKRTDIDPETKLKLLNDLQVDYLKLVKQKPEPVSVQIVQSATEPSVSSVLPIDNESIDADNIEKMIYQSVPSRLKKKAQAVLQTIKANPDVMSWDSQGRFVYNNTAYKGSNMVDLVNDLLVPRKGYKPEGLEYFLRGLRQVNFPVTNVSNKLRRLAMEDMTPLDVRTPSPVKKTKKKDATPEALSYNVY